MKIDGNIITADEGKALKLKTDTATKSTITRVVLSASAAADNWEDCDYGEVGDPLKYSTLSIKRELAALGRWDAAKSLMESSGVWDDYILANYLAEDDSVFVAAKSAFVAQGILTQAELDEMLPKCIWQAE